ncbi:MAG: hypothetical protein IJC71_02925 [Clostridia bacterium]|nr:hypothetical protein [Clostridia bacterium]
MGFGLLTAGFILLANPVIHVADILPDAIGFFLIAAGLTKMSYFIGKIQQARDLFLKLAFIQIAKFFSIAFIPFTSGSALLLMSFVYGFLELLLFIPALNNLFEGISFAGLWYNGTAVYKKIPVNKLFLKTETAGEKKKYKLIRQKMDAEMLTLVKRTVLGFYIFRVIATLIPELTELEMYDYLGDVKTIQRSLVSYKPALYILFALIVIILAVRMIRRTAGYFGAIRKDEPFICALRAKYENDILPRETFFAAVRMKRVLLLFMFAAAASLILTADGVNLLVGIISSGLLFAAALILRRFAKTANFVLVLAAVRSILSIANLIFQIDYFSEYSVEAVEWIETAHNRYFTMAGLASVEYIVALASVLLFLTALMQAVKKHLESFGIQTDNAQYSKQNRDLEVYNAVGGKLLLCSILAILHYAFTCAYHYLLPTMSVISVISIAVTLIYIAYVIHTVHAMEEMLYDKEIEMN